MRVCLVLAKALIVHSKNTSTHSSGDGGVGEAHSCHNGGQPREELPPGHRRCGGRPGGHGAPALPPGARRQPQGAAAAVDQEQTYTKTTRPHVAKAVHKCWRVRLFNVTIAPPCSNGAGAWGCD
jgi:hypothetical protein